MIYCHDGKKNEGDGICFLLGLFGNSCENHYNILSEWDSIKHGK